MLNSSVDPCHIAPNLRFIRKIMGISQEEAASAMEISRASYAALESGSRSATFKDLLTLERISGVNMETWISSDIQSNFHKDFDSGTEYLSAEEFISEFAKLSSGGRRIIAQHISEYFRQEVKL